MLCLAQFLNFLDRFNMDFNGQYGFQNDKSPIDDIVKQIDLIVEGPDIYKVLIFYYIFPKHLTVRI